MNLPSQKFWMEPKIKRFKSIVSKRSQNASEKHYKNLFPICLALDDATCPWDFLEFYSKIVSKCNIDLDDNIFVACRQ